MTTSHRWHSRSPTLTGLALVCAATAGGCLDEPGQREVAQAVAATSRSARLKTIVVGDFLTAVNGGGGDVNANQVTAGSAETFTLVDVNGDALQDGDAVQLAAANGNFVSAEDGGGGAVHANRVAASTWETFTIHRVGGAAIQDGDQIQLQTTVKGLYLCALNGGGAGVVADRVAASTWETFTLQLATGGGGGTPPPPPPPPPPPGDGAPAGFWDATNIPVARNVMSFKFLNRTNGRFSDSEVFWSFKTAAINETHSIAQQPTYDMPANSSGRMYFFLCATGDPTCSTDPTKSPYFDFIEHTIGPAQYNGNTTRVDAFGLKIALRLHAADGFEATVGEDYATFAEDRAVTFQRFINEVPPEFQALAQPPFAPFRIVEPGAGGFNAGGAHATYYNAFVDQLWAANGITVPKPGPNGDGLGAFPDLSAAIYRHVGNRAGTFAANGQLLDPSLWTSSATFYQAAPFDGFAAFWHRHAIGAKAYGFPYDDVGGYSTFISHNNPQYMMVAIGW